MTFSIELVVMEVTNIKGRALEFHAQICKSFRMGFFRDSEPRIEPRLKLELEDFEFLSPRSGFYFAGWNIPPKANSDFLTINLLSGFLKIPCIFRDSRDPELLVITGFLSPSFMRNHRDSEFFYDNHS